MVKAYKTFKTMKKSTTFKLTLEKTNLLLLE